MLCSVGNNKESAISIFVIQKYYVYLVYIVIIYLFVLLLFKSSFYKIKKEYYCNTRILVR